MFLAVHSTQVVSAAAEAAVFICGVGVTLDLVGATVDYRSTIRSKDFGGWMGEVERDSMMFGVWFCWRSCSGFLFELQEVELEVDRISCFCRCWLMFFDVLPFVAAFQDHIVTL